MSYASATLASGGTAYFDGSFTVPVEVALPRIDYPFPDDTSTRQITRKYWVRSGSYSASSIATNTTDSVYTLAYLTEERIVGDPGADLYEFERVYNEVPKLRQYYESYVFPYPGSNRSQVAGTVGSSILSGITYNGGTGVFTWSSPTFGIGENAQIVIRAVGVTQVGGIVVTQDLTQSAFFKVAITNGYQGPRAYAGSSILISSASGFTFGAGIFTRDPQQRATVSRVVEDYQLFGVGSALCSPSSITPTQVFRVIDQTAAETDYLDTTTIPTISDYVDMIQLREEVQAESTILEQWRGNIYVIRNRTIPAL